MTHTLAPCALCTRNVLRVSAKAQHENAQRLLRDLHAYPAQSKTLPSLDGRVSCFLKIRRSARGYFNRFNPKFFLLVVPPSASVMSWKTDAGVNCW